MTPAADSVGPAGNVTGRGGALIMDRLLRSLSQMALGLGLLAAQAVPPGPATAQSAEDWGGGPLAIPAVTGEPTVPRAAPESPPRRQVLQPPAEFRRPPAPLLPGQRNRVAPDPMSGPPDIRITPGAGVRPQPRKLSPPPPPAALVAPLRPPVVVVPRPVPTTVPRPAPQPLPRRAAPRQPFPSILESLPPGTIRPLPGEILPGSRSRPPLPELPPPPTAPPPSPPAVPPPPWANRSGEGVRQQSVPWAWLLLGLGTGGAAVFLLQPRRRPEAVEGPLETLGIRIEPRPDPGVQTLRPVERLGESSGPSGEA